MPSINIYYIIIQYSYSVHHSGTFSVGTVGTEDIDCSTVDFTYVSVLIVYSLFLCMGVQVRCNSTQLETNLTTQLDGLTASLCYQQPGAPPTGKVTPPQTTPTILIIITG